MRDGSCLLLFGAGFVQQISVLLFTDLATGAKNVKDFFGNVPDIGITKTLVSSASGKKKFTKGVDVELSGDGTFKLLGR